MTDLSLPTVMKITDELAERHLITEVKGVSSGGKPPQMLQFNGSAYYIIGVDVNDYRVDAIIMDLKANIICERMRDIQERDSSARIVEYIKELVFYMLSQPEIDKEKILGIGIGISGLIDTEKGKVVFSSGLRWRDIDILTPIRRSFPFPIMLDNGTRAMAMGEKLVGHAIGVENFSCINFGHGIDSAIVMNGNLYYGNSELSGSLGHMSVEKNGLPCECGNIGCLDTVASPRAIAKKAREVVSNLSRGQVSHILDLVYGDVEKINVYTVFEAAENGDEVAYKLLSDSAEYVGMAVTSLMNIMDPELIIVEGKTIRSSKLFMRELRKVIEQRRMRFTGRDIKLLFSNIGKHVGAVGAGSFILNSFIENGGEMQRIS